MVERAPQTKQDEQYPLLRVDGGGGDGENHTPPSPTLVTPGWGVACSPKQSWLVRWPEYISACWMTLILLGISFLVFYALGMEAYRRQPVLIMKCNSSKPASDVYYHLIIQRGTYPPFMIYSEYLSSMATQYPSLHFHVIFLIDDSLQTAFRGPRHTRLINHLIYPTATLYSSFQRLDENSKRELTEFQRKYQNVNVTIMSLTKYMAMTPLKYKWRNIPLNYLPFYARIFSVWRNGGVGMDLNTFNNNFNSRLHVDRRISAILKQHNDGINVEDYTNALNKIDCEEENELFTVLYDIIHQIFNGTRTLLSRSCPFLQMPNEKGALENNEPLVRSNRNKREVQAPPNDTNHVTKVYVEILNSTNNTDLKKNEYQTLPNLDVNTDKITLNINEPNKAVEVTNSTSVDVINKLEGSNKSEILNKSDTRQLVMFYDFSIFSDGLAPSYLFQVSDSYGKPARYANAPTQLLSLDYEGMFVAASSKLHPFLCHLISADCQRMQPKFAIQVTHLTQCSGMFKEDTYCNNIYLL
ncbi:unnamed protein product [Chrysodeixis includens]|uniref:Uncharacterized protein n=1 Tax=Chrysodeixis includens TaxID=689277 RepID=A0A9P0BLR1_CHRIL|nr:unnamed protein product [Chrysodeixis includens]